MFKVICIKDGCKNPEMIPPVVGEYYTVTGMSTVYESSYYIKEPPLGIGGKRASYQSCLFAPISEISETTFEREYNKEKV